ncbi:uncharacterized protein LOC125491759 [Beta vulgaris subsp. vulgaris]|uniref:uncharacterized protein LOC125491759 n=1 Tax=Beta vulgaris subsp. vulgaris TaxID=3555 RepID=UPI002036CC2C|nr:uncharacterized protein LOC125491759 [Beta vulgaris subsp. vulgaris]
MAGVLIRNHEGHLLHAKAFNLGHSSVLIAEATALQQGIKLALHSGLRNIIIEGDNLLVINAFNNICSTQWKIANIIADCKLMLTHFASYQIRHVFREANRAADLIANVGHLVVSS